MKSKKIWLIPLILTATAGIIVLQSSLAPVSPAVSTETAADANTNGRCAYTWAYHDAPELTGKFSNLVLSLDPGAKAYASLYGEDCVYADGHADFHVMETDFYVRLPANDLTDEEAFGSWMTQVMQIVVKIPREEVSGNYGFVEFWFEKNETEHTIIRVPIQIYMDQAQDKSGVELYRFFSNAIPY
jgi:hypothetical protein